MTYVIWAVALFQMFILIYAPSVAVYGIVRMMISGNVVDTIRNPLFGLKTLSMEWGFAVWTMQFMLLGGVLCDFFAFQVRGCRPIIFQLL